ncbi:MAG: aminotransferase class III-fold pyridoxal phosphate-dependent enzyme [Chitinophagales bacterium]|nr:aminotransferase class III-fold pyridoxal phosphate-dependent enzyme [Chitinophagales bacterium]
MNLFQVYPLFNIHLEKGMGVFVYDNQDNEYLDFYGGHAVISIGHAHPHFVKRIEQQLHQLPYYSNSIYMTIQEELAHRITTQSNYPSYELFLCNSGAEANENALKLASFYTGKKKVIAFKGAFHGRTSAAVAVTDNPKIKAPINDDSFVVHLPFNDETALENEFMHNDICAVIIEPIQGVNGIEMPSNSFLQKIQQLCNAHNAIFIADEIQCGFGRSGKFFAHQLANVQADIIAMAKGMGNGFPVAGILISPKIKAQYGMLGTTFGGAPLACAASLAVLEVLEQDNLIEHAADLEIYIRNKFKDLPNLVQIRGKGLMIGLEFNFPIKDLRNRLLYEEKIFTGNASNPTVLRLLPSLSIQKEHLDTLYLSLTKLLS